MSIPDVAYFVSAADKLYEEIRDLSKHEATHALAKALLKEHGQGGDAVFKDLRMTPILIAATPQEAR